MLQFQVLTPTPSAPSNISTQSSGFNGPSARRDSTFLVLTPEPAAPAVQERRGSNFLVLSPVYSDSYPIAPTRGDAVAVFSPSEASSSPKSSPLLSPIVGAIPVGPRARRSTSGSSNGETEAKRRFLKLNPVHGAGEEGVDDYAIEE